MTAPTWVLASDCVGHAALAFAVGAVAGLVGGLWLRGAWRVGRKGLVG